ncbi:MAG: SHOCT domain-containing protein [Solirubrobacterales bacterium]
MPNRRQRRRRLAAAGGAAAAAKHRRDAQAEEAQAAPPPAQPAPSAGMSAEAIEKLKELGQLHEQGVLTDEEFASEKSKLL